MFMPTTEHYYDVITVESQVKPPFDLEQCAVMHYPESVVFWCGYQSTAERLAVWLMEEGYSFSYCYKEFTDRHARYLEKEDQS